MGIVLEHGKTYLNSIGQRVTVKRMGTFLFRGKQTNRIYMYDGSCIGEFFSWDLVSETDGLFKHLLKQMLKYVTKNKE